MLPTIFLVGLAFWIWKRNQRLKEEIAILRELREQKQKRKRSDAD
jgi:hypothetical protein